MMIVPLKCLLYLFIDVFMLCQVWAGGAGDGVASLVVFGGETINSQGQTTYLNDVWLYTPHTGAWREVRRTTKKSRQIER